MAEAAIQFGFENYRAGAIERIGDAYLLLRAGQYASSIYLAGRAVEGVLRALVWKSDIDIRQGKSSLDTGHDLRELLSLVGNLGLLASTPQGRRRSLDLRILRISRLWYNNMRFAASKHVETRWLRIGEFGHKRPFKTFKEAATAYYNDCDSVVKHCEALCERAN